MATTATQKKVDTAESLINNLNFDLDKAAARDNNDVEMTVPYKDAEVMLEALRVYKRALNGKAGRLGEIDRISDDLKRGNIFTSTRREHLTECTTELVVFKEILED